ncbi:carbohydrate kinase [Lithospermum erythrorhizon]|uniref:Carbohydrate kinase n=1 Tax=Lithospermum erythrorhizon TaxID=34254 RepID=A0AAV3PGD8_LITER
MALEQVQTVTPVLVHRDPIETSGSRCPFDACSSSAQKKWSSILTGVSLAESRGFDKAPGGAPANVACAITKLGGTSAFVGKVGDDEFGRMLVDIFEKNGVNISGVCYDMHARTALAFVTLKKDGERERVHVL